jgi:hypothetical protein
LAVSAHEYLHSVKPQPASRDRAAHPSQVKLARFLAHVEAIAGPVLAAVRGRVAAELIVGFSAGVSLTDAGHNLDNYLFPVAQRLGPERVAAVFGRKIHGPSSLAVGPARPGTAGATPQFCAPCQFSLSPGGPHDAAGDQIAMRRRAVRPVLAGGRISCCCHRAG